MKGERSTYTVNKMRLNSWKVFPSAVKIRLTLNYSRLTLKIYNLVVVAQSKYTIIILSRIMNEAEFPAVC